MSIVSGYVADRQLPDVLYHYTDAAGLLGIIRSGALRATHARFLNDVSEIIHGVAVLKEACTRSGIAGGWDQVGLEYYGRVLDHLDTGVDRPTWIASLSELADDLSQWRAYSASGGYAIGFDANTFQRCLQESGFRLLPCSYSRDFSLHSRTVAAVFRRMEDFSYSGPQRFHRENEQRRARGEVELSPEEFIDQFASHSWGISNEVYWEAASYKHPSFEAEREWRAVRVDDSEFADCSFRSRGASLVPYVEIPLGKEGLPIVSITTSPGLDEKTSAALTLFVRHFAMKLPRVQIRKSASPYATA